MQENDHLNPVPAGGAGDARPGEGEAQHGFYSERRRFNRLLIPFSVRCLNASFDQLDREIEEGLKEVNSFFGSDRVLLWEFSEDGQQAQLTHSYSDAGVDLPARSLLHENLPYIFERIRGLENLCISRPDDLPQAARVDKQYLERFGIRSFIVIPLIVGGTPRGGLSLACISTERAWSNEDLFNFQRIGMVLAGVLDRKHSRQMIEQRMRFETLITDLSARLIKAPLSEVDREIEQAFARILDFFQADRGGLLGIRPDLKFVSITHASYTEGMERVSGDVNLASLFPWSYEKLVIQGNHVNISSMAELPSEAEIDRQAWTAMGVRSSLTIPLFIGQRTGHIIILQTIRQERSWPEEYVPRLRLMGEIFVNALERRKTDATLNESEEKFREFFQNTPDYCYIISSEGTILNVNQSALRALGYEREEMIGKPVSMIYDAGSYTKMKGLFDQWKISGQIRNKEMVIITKQGEKHTVLLNVGAVRDKNGMILYSTSVQTDITERKRAEEALQKSEERILSLVENTSDLIWSVDMKSFGLLTFNHALRNYFSRGHGLEIHAGMTPDQMLPQDYAAQWSEFYARALREGSFVTEYVTSAKSHVLLLSINCLKLRGEVFGISVFGRDITDRKRAEEALKKSEERFRQVAENVGDFIWEVDNKGLYRYTSPAVEKIMGYTPDELIGKMHFYDLFAPEVREDLKTAAFNAFAAKESFRALPNANVSKDGKIVHLETSGVPMLDESGNLAGYRGSDTDVTERKRMEEQLQARFREIEGLKQELERENIILRTEASLLFEHGDIVGESAAMKAVLTQAEQVARTDSTVLITGETGTGKELLAREIHNLSSRKDRLLVTVNCASLPPTLIESELFGREKGAYTGAMTRMAGRFETADGSTILLDEIGELPTELQAKLLRVIEEGTFERLGSTKTIHVNVRIIAATNRDLSQDVQEGRFRRDLFYRLNVFPIVVPPLRERPEDIPLLVWAFVRQFEKKMGKQIESIPRFSIDSLQRYAWPGNVRELRNVIEHAMIVSRGKTLDVSMPAVSNPEQAEDDNLEAIERRHILTALQRSGWRINGAGGAAEALGLKRTTLQSKMKKLGIERPSN
jgi:PAS domain S-box-containing protein